MRRVDKWWSEGRGKVDKLWSEGRGESTSGGARDEGESTSGEARVKSEQSTSNDDEEQDSAVKRPRLKDISTLADEPLPEWLGNLLRNNLHHVALLIYTNLFYKSLAYRRRTQLVLLPTLYRRVNVLPGAE